MIKVTIDTIEKQNKPKLDLKEIELDGNAVAIFEDLTALINVVIKDISRDTGLTVYEILDLLYNDLYDDIPKIISRSGLTISK